MLLRHIGANFYMLQYLEPRSLASKSYLNRHCDPVHQKSFIIVIEP